jgi:hypothetical protein
MKIPIPGISYALAVGIPGDAAAGDPSRGHKALMLISTFPDRHLMSSAERTSDNVHADPANVLGG